MICLDLPMPPSTNNLFYNKTGQGRVKTQMPPTEGACLTDGVVILRLRTGLSRTALPNATPSAITNRRSESWRPRKKLETRQSARNEAGCYRGLQLNAISSGVVCAIHTVFGARDRTLALLHFPPSGNDPLRT